MKGKKFYEICDEIRKRRPFQYWSYKIGKKREEKVISSLRELKKEGIIRDFLQTGNLSFQDVMEGKDFFLVYIRGAKYRVCPLSVTGERWAEGDRERHPEIPVVTISLSDTSTSIKNKIIEVINQNK